MAFGFTSPNSLGAHFGDRFCSSDSRPDHDGYARSWPSVYLPGAFDSCTGNPVGSGATQTGHAGFGNDRFQNQRLLAQANWQEEALIRSIGQIADKFDRIFAKYE